MSYTKFITHSLEEASKITNSNFGKVSNITKTGDNNQVLTETDLQVGKLLINKVNINYPKYNIIDEEAGVINNDSQYTWVIDPVDGTSNFANGLPMYGIMIGLLDKDISIAGGIALPYFNEIYVAERSGGAFCNGKSITVSNETSLLKSLIAYGIDGHQENPGITNREADVLGDIILSIRNLRSSNSAYDVAMVASGKYGGNLNRTSKIWDNVAQQVVIEEAGGVYTDFFGKPMDYSNALKRVDENYTFCAAAPALHKQLQAIIQSNLS